MKQNKLKAPMLSKGLDQDNWYGNFYFNRRKVFLSSNYTVDTKIIPALQSIKRGGLMNKKYALIGG